jgi:photosystem II stability/assembly factor-like uncharacterized protein
MTGKIVYFAGNIVYRSTDWGKTWTAISGDLSKNDKSRQGNAGGPILKENTVAEYYGTVYSFAESPAQAGVLWAGTDDGNLQVSQNGGQTWTNVTPNVTGVGPDAVVSGIEASRTAAGTAYAAFERRMSDDFKPYVYKTTDFGRTWTNIAGNLPAANWVQTVREDPKNPNLLYVGTELGLYVSWSGGTQWTRLHLKNFPAVAVHEVIVHPRENDLILATHGRAGLGVRRCVANPADDARDCFTTGTPVSHARRHAIQYRRPVVGLGTQAVPRRQHALRCAHHLLVRHQTGR